MFVCHFSCIRFSPLNLIGCDISSYFWKKTALILSPNYSNKGLLYNYINITFSLEYPYKGSRMKSGWVWKDEISKEMIEWELEEIGAS